MSASARWKIPGQDVYARNGQDADFAAATSGGKRLNIRSFVSYPYKHRLRSLATTAGSRFMSDIGRSNVIGDADKPSEFHIFFEHDRVLY
jgi:hypothetical protein